MSLLSRVISALLAICVLLPAVSGCLASQPDVSPGNASDPEIDPRIDDTDATIRIPAPRIGTEVDYGTVTLRVEGVEGSGTDRVLTIEQGANRSATFTFRPGTGLPLERTESEGEYRTRYHAEYRSFEGWLATIGHGTPWPPFFLWNRTLPLGEEVEIALFDGTIRVLAEPAEALRGRLTPQSTKALDALDGNTDNRSIVTVTPELPSRSETRSALLVFAEDQAFPEVLATERGSPTEVRSLRVGDDPVAWSWRPDLGYDWPCTGKTAAFNRSPPDGDASGMPFPFSEGLAAAKNTSSWGDYVEDHPDAYINHARFRDLSEVQAGAGGQPPRYEWLLVLVHPNDEAGTAWARVYEVTKPPHPEAVAAVTSEDRTPIGPRPPVPEDGMQVTTFGWVYRHFTDRFPDDRVDLSWWRGDVDSTYYVGETRALVHDEGGSEAPLTNAYGGEGCFLRAVRLEL